MGLMLHRGKINRGVEVRGEFISSQSASVWPL